MVTVLKRYPTRKHPGEVRQSSRLQAIPVVSSAGGKKNKKTTPAAELLPKPQILLWMYVVLQGSVTFPSEKIAHKRWAFMFPLRMSSRFLLHFKHVHLKIPLVAVGEPSLEEIQPKMDWGSPSQTLFKKMIIDYWIYCIFKFKFEICPAYIIFLVTRKQLYIIWKVITLILIKLRMED